jgi:hypothetical protein
MGLLVSSLVVALVANFFHLQLKASSMGRRGLIQSWPCHHLRRAVM